MKTLIIVFSRGGRTLKRAKKLAEHLGDADLFEIKAPKEYGGYFKAIKIARSEFKANEITEVVEKCENLKDYDRVIVGFPIWYGKCPRAVVSFVEAHDFTGKDVYLFSTSGMSGIEKAAKGVMPSFKGAKVHGGLKLNKFKEAKVDEWLAG